MKGLNGWVTLIVIIVGIVVGLNVNHSISLDTTLDQNQNKSEEGANLKTEKTEEVAQKANKVDYSGEEKAIKEALDKYMFENFKEYYETSWYSSVSATGCVINDQGKQFIIQSKGDAFNANAEKFLGAALGFFNDKTIEEIYKVDKLILIDVQKEIIKEVETIKW